MRKEKKWDIYFRLHDCPCIVTEKFTNILLYCNDKFIKQFNIKNEKTALIGKNVNDIPEMKKLKLIKDMPSLDNFNYFESEVLNTSSNTKLLLRSIISSDDDTIFCEMLPIDNIKEYKYEEAMAESLEILQLPQEQVIPSLMKLLNKFYNSRTAYINRIDYTNKILQCEFDLCSHPDLERENFPNILKHTELLFEWLDSRDELGIIETNVLNEIQTPLSNKILETFSLSNIIAHVIEDTNGEPYSVVGLTQCEDGFLDLRLLKSVATFIGHGLGKVDMDNAISNLKHIDNLTGFKSRISYSEKVDEIISNHPQSIGVISVNINGLKKINEQIGYTKGDKYIKEASEKLQQYFEYDFYRVSGDEFIGIATNIEKEKFENDVTSLQKEMRDNKDYTFALGFSFGQKSYDYTKLIIEADTFMYINKQEYYANSNRNFEDVSDSILSNLLSYLENDEFMIYLQPQVKLKDSSLYGAEALIRRFDKTNQKMVFPDQFIPLYEQKSVIRHVDMFVVETVCKLLAKWNKDNKAIPISVNLSRVTLQEFGIVDSIVKICDKYSVPHNLLVIEVTERVGLVENNVASALITSFKDNGFNISLDDFGCAYSNIVTLAQIEVDEVKIDKSLVDDLTTSKKNHILVKNVLSMCNELDGASTLAEGIEDEAQAKLLYELGCHLGQGYFFSRPIPVNEFEETYIN